MLLVKDKWDEYVIENERGDEYAALGLLRERIDPGFWYYDEALERAREIDKAKDAPAALEFLLERRDAEYEWVEITTAKVV